MKNLQMKWKESTNEDNRSEEFFFRYANGDRDSLENVTLDVEEGTFNVLCGKSG